MDIPKSTEVLASNLGGGINNFNIGTTQRISCVSAITSSYSSRGWNVLQKFVRT